MITYCKGTDIIDNVNQNHDTYKLGEFKDDQLQKHRHHFEIECDHSDGNERGVYRRGVSNYSSDGHNTDYNSGRSGDVTRGKRKGVNYLIKVL